MGSPHIHLLISHYVLHAYRPVNFSKIPVPQIFLRATKLTGCSSHFLPNSMSEDAKVAPSLKRHITDGIRCLTNKTVGRYVTRDRPHGYFAARKRYCDGCLETIGSEEKWWWRIIKLCWPDSEAMTSGLRCCPRHGVVWKEAYERYGPNLRALPYVDFDDEHLNGTAPYVDHLSRAK